MSVWWREIGKEDERRGWTEWMFIIICAGLSRNPKRGMGLAQWNDRATKYYTSVCVQCAFLKGNRQTLCERSRLGIFCERRVDILT